MEQLILPEDVNYLLDKLLSCGYEAYVVGGCVRDSIMGVTPHDWDICTSALPEETAAIFSDLKVIPTGMKHGTVTVMLNESKYEITTFRIDGEYKDNRHPDNVNFVSDLRQDLMRRDFTINALAYNKRDGLIDYFGGIEDLRNGIIKCVGIAEERFQEDALRVMRAIRFALRYGFVIDSLTENAMLNQRELLKNISAERISTEVTEILSYDLRNKERLLFELMYLLSVVVPEFKNVSLRSISDNLQQSEPILEVRLALLFDFTKPELENALRSLRFSNHIINTTLVISEYGRLILEDNSWWPVPIPSVAENKYDKTDYFTKSLLRDIGFEQTIMSVEYAIAKVAEYHMDKVSAMFLKANATRIVDGNIPFNLSRMRINGNDLLQIGYKGKSIGNMLNALLDLIMKDVLPNDRDVLLVAAKTLQRVVE